MFGGEGNTTLPTETFTIGLSTEWEVLTSDATTGRYAYAATVNNEIYMQGDHLKENLKNLL